MLVTREAAEVENEQPPRLAAAPANAPVALRNRTATKHQRPIDIVTVEPQPVTSPDAPESAFSSATRVSVESTIYTSYIVCVVGSRIGDHLVMTGSSVFRNVR